MAEPLDPNTRYYGSRSDEDTDPEELRDVIDWRLDKAGKDSAAV